MERKRWVAKEHFPNIDPGNVRLFDCNEQPDFGDERSVLTGIISPALPLLRNGKVI